MIKTASVKIFAAKIFSKKTFPVFAPAFILDSIPAVFARIIKRIPRPVLSASENAVKRIFAKGARLPRKSQTAFIAAPRIIDILVLQIR